MKNQVYKYSRYKPITMRNNDKLVKADLIHTVVVTKGNKTFEMTEKEFEQCEETWKIKGRNWGIIFQKT